MGYLKQYFTPRILLHELNDKFLNFEPLHIRVERILSLGRKHQSKFTFFVTAEHIKQNNAQILQDITSNGHEIGTHSFQHINFLEIDYKKALNQIQKSLNILFGYYPVKGFRAPYLRANDYVEEACKACGLQYSSSNPGKELLNKNGFWRIPVTKPMDYEIIQIEGLTNVKDISERWCSLAKPGEVLLFHPWRLGAKKYIHILDRILSNGIKFGTIQELIPGNQTTLYAFNKTFI